MPRRYRRTTESSASFLSQVDAVARDEWAGVDAAAAWRDGEKYSHEQPVDWSSVTLPEGFPPPEDVSPVSVVVLTNAGFSERHALVALRVCRNELTKACDWLFKHRYAGDLDAVARAVDAGAYDDERWDDEHYHAPKDGVASLDPDRLPKAGERVPGKGIMFVQDYASDDDDDDGSGAADGGVAL